ncbi:alkaline phosphatase D family protein [Streptomyces sp. TRM68416]|uniref:alkaline phosphatase D family protein n=1 Tax=Streptomyces sp. TRM68416 TaxID=2758412 RepID=UPI001661945E|nr:alkaline phosphatase D family protein [Streptomyces sp. TRM68416]MBD0838777.1 alkaline phosphatase D family protein [Streptomyces sp. TRM68416]
MSMIWMSAGAVTDTSARCAVRVTTGPVRIAVSTSPAMTSPAYTASTPVTATGTAVVDVTGLTADTRYYWQVEDNGVIDASVTGQFLTDPPLGQPASFTVGVGGDAGLTPMYPGVTGSAPSRLSNHPVHDTIRTRALAEGWRRFCHIGDICYYDLGSGNHGLSAAATATQYRTMWDDIYGQPNQAALYREVPWVYVWDDHDYGPNNSDSTAPGRANARTVYRERVPSYPLPAGAGDNPIYHSFEIGRVLFVASDSRSDRVAGSTLLGAPQLAWLDTLLGSSTAAALVWLMPNPWLGPSSDTWGGYPDEQADIIAMLDGHGWLNRMVMVSADKHVNAIDSGRAGSGGEAYGGFPNMVCASLDATPGSYTTQYDGGMWPARGQYGTVTVHDTGTAITLTATAWRGTKPLGWTYAVTGGTTRVPAGPASHVLAL